MASEDDLLNSALSYENECFVKGFEEGSQAGLEQGKLEGRELGIQTGFEKFLTLGYLKGRLAHWNSQGLHTERNRKNIEKITELVSVYSLENDPDAVEELSLRLKKAKALAVLLQRTLGGPELNFGVPESKNIQQELED